MGCLALNLAGFLSGKKGPNGPPEERNGALKQQADARIAPAQREQAGTTG